jgi:hypothetical protein
MSISERKMADLLFPYVRSVLGAKDKETPEFVGSGILLKSHGCLYLITAAHVMDHFDEEKYPLFLDGIDGLVAISGEEICSYTEDIIKRKDDKHDISIVKLRKEMQSRLESAYFIVFQKMDLIGEHDPHLGYFCVGIPSKRGDKSIDKNNSLITPEPYGLFAKEADCEIYDKLNVDKKTHLALSFNAKKAYSQDRVKRTAPSLNGLSGAPIWGVIKKSNTEIQAVIVAILIEYHQKDIKSVLGTRVEEVFRGTFL